MRGSKNCENRAIQPCSGRRFSVEAPPDARALGPAKAARRRRTPQAPSESILLEGCLSSCRGGARVQFSRRRGMGAANLTKRGVCHNHHGGYDKRMRLSPTRAASSTSGASARTRKPRAGSGPPWRGASGLLRDEFLGDHDRLRADSHFQGDLTVGVRRREPPRVRLHLRPTKRRSVRGVFARGAG